MQAKTNLSVFALGKDAIGKLLLDFPSLTPLMKKVREQVVVSQLNTHTHTHMDWLL